jgi:hypothetical protein
MCACGADYKTILPKLEDWAESITLSGGGLAPTDAQAEKTLS